MNSSQLTTKLFVLGVLVFERSIYKDILCRSGYCYLAWSIDSGVSQPLSIAIEGVDVGMRGVRRWRYRVAMVESLNV